MTYSPSQVGIQDGTDFFTSIGLIGGSTGMQVLPCSMPSAMVAPYGYRDTIVPTVTGSVLKGVSTSNTENKHMGWNLDGGDGSTTYTKALGVAYLCSAGTIMCHMGFSTDAIASGSDTDFLDHHYSGGVRQYSSEGATIWKYDGGNAAVGADATINTYQEPYSPLTGIAFYVEDDIQKLYLKKGSESQWIPILSTADETFSGIPFRSYAQVYAAYFANKTTRIVTPVMVWGVES